MVEATEVAAFWEQKIIKAKMGKMLEVMRDEMKPNYFASGAKGTQILNLVMKMVLKLGTEVFIRQSGAGQKRLDQQATLRRAKLIILVFYLASLIAFAYLNAMS